MWALQILMSVVRVTFVSMTASTVMDHSPVSADQASL